MSDVYRLSFDNVFRIPEAVQICTTRAQQVRVCFMSKNVLKHQKCVCLFTTLPQVPKIYDTPLRLP